MRLCGCFNSLAPGRPGCHFKTAIFNLVLLIGIFTSSNDNALRWMPWDFTNDKSTLVQVMARCRQATSHYLSQCWPSSMSPTHHTVSPGHNELNQSSRRMRTRVPSQHKDHLSRYGDFHYRSQYHVCWGHQATASILGQFSLEYCSFSTQGFAWGQCLPCLHSQVWLMLSSMMKRHAVITKQPTQRPFSDFCLLILPNPCNKVYHNMMLHKAWQWWVQDRDHTMNSISHPQRQLVESLLWVFWGTYIKGFHGPR